MHIMGVNPGGDGGDMSPPSEGCPPPPPQKKKKKNHTLYCEKYMYVYLQ